MQVEVEQSYFTYTLNVWGLFFFILSFSLAWLNLSRFRFDLYLLYEKIEEELRFHSSNFNTIIMVLAGREKK